MSIDDEDKVVDLFGETTHWEQHEEFDAAEVTFYDFQEAAAQTLGPDANPLMLALGVVGEAGEVADVAGLGISRHVGRIAELIKKGYRPGREVDRVHLKEEIGDELWYLAVLADFHDLDFEEIAVENLEKLEKRYGEKA